MIDNDIARVPNILITGTPCTGKTTLAELLVCSVGFKYINVSQLATEYELFDGFDQTLNCPIIDQDLVMDEMEDSLAVGGCIVDYHSCDFFPKRWFDAVFVLRTDNSILYDRLQSRGYSGKKLDSNLSCEIFQTILDEARESYDQDIVHELHSNCPEDMDRNVDQILQWLAMNGTTVNV